MRLATIALLAALTCLAVPVQAESVLRDMRSGVAIDGYDPVAYFTEGRARTGSRDFEAEWAGVVWRFANEGNRAVFLDAPARYAPRFGGHSVVAVARGFAGSADPQLWAIHQGRLYFFEASRQAYAFSLDPDGFAARAEARWDEVARLLAP